MIAVRRKSDATTFLVTDEVALFHSATRVERVDVGLDERLREA
jgi:hypothetical protein